MRLSEGYGTVSEPPEVTANPNPNPNGTGRLPSDEEQQSLLPSKETAGTISAHLQANISRQHSDIVLLFCYVITGLLDSASISIWGSFVSMQTGNTVYVGLGLASPGTSARLPRSSLSIVAFCIGSYFFSRFHRRFGQRRRWVLCASFAAQLALCLAAALIVTLAPSPVQTTTTAGGGPVAVHWRDIVPIALVAFQSCGQAVASRALKFNALTSVVLTSIYCDLFSDQDLLRGDNLDRNRRAAAPILLVVGAVAGGLFAGSSVGIAGALWTAVALKAVVIVAWGFWESDMDQDDEDE